MEKDKVKIQFNLEANNFSLLQHDDYCSIAQIDFLHLGENRNKCYISEESVKKSLKTFYNKPLLCILDNSIIPSLSTDFLEHAWTEEDRKKFVAFGTIPESSDFELIKRENGKTYLTANVVIWKSYFPIVMNILKKRAGNVKVSIELMVVDGEQDEDTGILNIKEFKLLSCVMLGESIMEGIEGSHLEMLKFSLNSSDLEEANKHYLEFSKKKSIHKIPEEILTLMQEGLNSYKKIGHGCSSTDLAFSKKMCKEKYLDGYNIDRIKETFSKAKSEENALLYNILGGEVCEKWIKNIERVGEFSMKGLSDRELSEAIYTELSQYKYKDGDWEGKKYYVEELYSDEKVAIVRDNETTEYYKIPYSIENGRCTIDMAEKKLVRRTYDEVFSLKEFSAEDTTVFAQKDYGTGETIDIDKSKEAMSESSWGSVNKTELRKKVLEAKNYKSLVKDVYALVEEGWEEAPSSKLKYPIMEIKDGKAVYNRYALSSALAYAVKNNETAVVSKVKSLYKKLEIEDEGGEKKMAKELDEKEIEKNKLDKDNKDIEKIKDDAEAQEDDVKEEKKNACEDEMKNKIEKDDKGEEGLEDDVDADKDYWKKKANALEIENAEMKSKIEKYERAEEEKEMSAELDKFAHCMSEDEMKEMKNSIEKMSKDEFKNQLNAKIAEFALKMAKEEKEEEKEEKEVKYSYNPYFEVNSMKFSKEEADSLDAIIKNSNVKMADK